MCSITCFRSRVLRLFMSPSSLFDLVLFNNFRGAPVTQSVERWTCDWKVAGLNLGVEGPCRTISIFPALCAD